MGEVDTKSIKSVQAALCLFGEKIDRRKNWTCSSIDLEKERELEALLKDLANHKVQLEANDLVYKQTVLKLDHYHETAEELSFLLENSDFEKFIYMSECKEAKKLINELESKKKEMGDQLLEAMKIREHFSNVVTELKCTQSELLRMEIELASARESKIEAMTQTEMIETELEMEKVKTEALLRHLSELNEAVLHSNLAVLEAEKEKCEVLSQKEAELELAIEKAVEAQQQLENMRKKLESMQELENQLVGKSELIESLKSDLEVEEGKNSDQENYIKSLEMELNELKLELKNANETLRDLKCEIETVKVELEKAKNEMEKIKVRETEAQVEIAILNSELHKGRSKIAASEAAEERAKSEKSGLYLAVQRLALEAEEAKKENRRLKESESFSRGVELQEIDETMPENEEKRDNNNNNNNNNNTQITISIEEYEDLIKKADQVDEYGYEFENLKKELEIARVRIGEFRIRSEQALSRAKVAEIAKEALEDQIRRWREQREKKKAALEALREDLKPKEICSFKHEMVHKTYQPLGKVLNMKF